MNIAEAINKAKKILISNNIKSPELDTELLMSKVLNKSREEIILDSNKEIEEKILIEFNSLVIQRSKGKPIAYLIRKKNFWKNSFVVNENVLVPRPDTELIIEEVLRLFKNKKKLNVLDIGTGSGCIILSILDEKKEFTGIGIDISQKCINISRTNAYNIGIKNRVKFFKSDVDNFNYGKYDLILSNPPYIKQAKLRCLEKDVIGFEPKIALDGGLDGLSVIRKVVKKSSELIKNNGKLVLEIGFDQKEKVKLILKKEGYYINKILKDYAGHDRCIISTKK